MCMPLCLCFLNQDGECKLIQMYAYLHSSACDARAPAPDQAIDQQAAISAPSVFLRSLLTSVVCDIYGRRVQCGLTFSDENGNLHSRCTVRFCAAWPCLPSTHRWLCDVAALDHKITVACFAVSARLACDLVISPALDVMPSSTAPRDTQNLPSKALTQERCAVAIPLSLRPE